MSDQSLWYTTRAAGAVSLVFLSVVVVLGILSALRVGGRRWPRFLTAGLHGNLALLAVVFLALHIVTAVVDPYTSLGLTPVLVPFASSYRPLWLGLGTVALDLLVAVIATSLIRRRIGARAWRRVHWVAYACWPIAVVHGLGTGSDAAAPWLITTTVACCVAVASAALWRLAAGPADPLADARRLAAAAATRGGRP